MAVIDAHAHVWEKDHAAFPWSTQLGISPDFEAPVQALLAEMRSCGVDSVVLVQPSNYGYDNSYMLECIRKHPGACVGIGLVNPWSSSVQHDLQVLAAEDRVVGVRLVAALNPKDPWLDAPLTHLYWSAVQKLGLTVCVLVRPIQLPALEAVVSRWPGVKVVVDHLGHAMIDPAPRDTAGRGLMSLARCSNVYVKVSGFTAISHGPYPYQDLFPMVQDALELFGPSRLMWASDFPYVQRRCSYAAALDIVRSKMTFLDDTERAWLLHDTAVRVWPALA